MTDPCPCGRDNFATCCAPYLARLIDPPTAEALMRSRFTAYVRGDHTWLAATHQGLDETAAETLARHARGIRWTKLDIRRTEAGGVADDTGLVEFIAWFIQRGGKPGRLHEISRFERVAGRWMYIDGTPPRPHRR